MPAVVLIHGLFGWGEERPLCGLGPTYFPLQHLRKLWHHGPVVAVDVGIASSDHDRACEAFAQLLGLRVDYGEEHAEKCDHVRFGTIYESALLDHWDASNPVHLVGHSFGGNTAVLLFDLIAEDYFGLGTGPDWVLSVSCVCSPLRGCTLPSAIGLEMPYEPGTEKVLRRGSSKHMLAAFVHLVWKAQQRWPSVLRPLFNIRMDQWQEHNTARNVLSSEHALWNSMDNMLSEVTPRYRRDILRSRFGNLCKTYLIAVVAGPLEPLAPAALARTCAPYAGVATAVWFISLIGAWRFRHRARQTFRQVAAMDWAWRMLIMLVAWNLTSSCIAAFTLFAPQLKHHREAWGARLQLALEPFRPFLHGCLARPLLRLSAYALRRAQVVLPASSALVSSESGNNFLGDSDGVIDSISQQGLDAPAIGRITKLTCSSLTSVRSSGSARAVHESTLTRVSRTDTSSSQDDDEVAPEKLEMGKWRVIHVPGADHCLGTWLDPQHTPAMYASVFGLLEGSRIRTYTDSAAGDEEARREQPRRQATEDEAKRLAAEGEMIKAVEEEEARRKASEEDYEDARSDSLDFDLYAKVASGT